MSAILTAIVANIRARLRPACSDMPQDEFDELTQRMAAIQYKYDMLPALPLATFPPDIERLGKIAIDFVPAPGEQALSA